MKSSNQSSTIKKKLNNHKKIKAGTEKSRPALVIKNAREHNLRSVSLEIPKNALCVVTGVSGSGKSSLAFDTILKEGQRRYVASLSSYARQFIQASDKADVDAIEGLSPTISIDQKSGGVNPRSTVGTITEIYDYLRLFYARIGVPHCPNGHGVIANETTDVVHRTLMRQCEGRTVLIMAPIVLDRKGEYRKEQEMFYKDGFLRMLINGKLQRIEEPVALARYEKHRLEVVIDRVDVASHHATRIIEAIKKASELAAGKISVLRYDKLDRNDNVSRVTYKEGKDYFLFNLKNTCRVCGVGVPELEPRLFSYNSLPHACQVCRGLGEQSAFDGRFFVADENEGISNGALHVINDRGNVLYANYGGDQIKAIYKYYGFALDTPWKELPVWFHNRLFYGYRDDEAAVVHSNTGKKKPLSALSPVKRRKLLKRKRRHSAVALETIQQKLDGNAIDDKIDFHIIEALDWVYDTYKIRPLEKYRRVDMCKSCDGSGLGEIARNVSFRGKAIYELNVQTVQVLHDYFTKLLKGGVSEVHEEIWKPVVREIHERLGLLLYIGLEYLTLNRKANTLSGGEAQRIRLASQIGSGLEGCLYILDEPSIGLHASDNQKLIQMLRKLRDKKNSLIVVEHDEETMLASDYLLELGPGAGIRGGAVTFSGGLKNLTAQQVKGVTLDYLVGKKYYTPPLRNDRFENWLKFEAINRFNLANLTVSFPLGHLTVITGVSGSGKSTLMNVMTRAIKDSLNHYKKQWRKKRQQPTTAYHKRAATKKDKASSLDEESTKQCPEERLAVYGQGSRDVKYITGLRAVENFLLIDQKPIGRTSRSNPATYTKAWDTVRDIFANQKSAKIRGYTKSHFSFNVPGGRCQHCEGSGVIEMDMQMFAPVEVVCEVCNGKRFHTGVLNIFYNEKNIYDVLEMSIEEAYQFFKVFKKLERILGILVNIGLGYMKVGQLSTTLSGGEAQRIKLAAELSKSATGTTVYFLDEPTTGLHFEDIKRLLSALYQLTKMGQTVVVIEHNMEVIQAAEYLLELGPGGGEAGGKLIVNGALTELLKKKTPTALAFQEYSDRQHKKKQGHYLKMKNFNTLLKKMPATSTVNQLPSPVRKDTVRKINALANENQIIVEDLKTNNLKNVSFTIPKYQVTVVTGVSGSGKSSIALESIFLEGQRKYLESLSTYARRFLGRIGRVNAERMDNLSPTICIDRKRVARSPRSIIATHTEIYDYLRVLYGNIGRPHCLKCDLPLTQYTPAQVVQNITKEYTGATLLFLAPLWLEEFTKRSRASTSSQGIYTPASDFTCFIETKDKLNSYLELILERGYLRMVIDGQLVRIGSDVKGTDRTELVEKMKQAHHIFLVIDRFKIREQDFARILEATERSYKLSNGLLRIEVVTSSQSKEPTRAQQVVNSHSTAKKNDSISKKASAYQYYTRFLSCMDDFIVMKDVPTARDFSFNYHLGACAKCSGLGFSRSAALTNIILNENGVIFKAGSTRKQKLTSAWVSDLDNWINSDDIEAVKLRNEGGHWTPSLQKLTWRELFLPEYRAEHDLFFYGKGRWRGFYAFLELITVDRSKHYRTLRNVLLSTIRMTTCTACGGGRLNAGLLRVRVAGHSIYDVTRYSVTDAYMWSSQLLKRLSGREKEIVKEISKEITFRLKQMLDLGLGYLTLNRRMATLAGGEVERIRLSTQMGSRLSDVIYVLDEPSVGLHEYENHLLVKIIKRLKQLGNTVVIVEHSAGVIEQADYIIDVGPAAGEHGGTLTYVGRNDKRAAGFDKCSFYPYLYTKNQGLRKLIYNRNCNVSERNLEQKTLLKTGGYLQLTHVRRHNLKDFTVRVPLCAITGISGVSGSGKSSLIEWIQERFSVSPADSNEEALHFHNKEQAANIGFIQAIKKDVATQPSYSSKRKKNATKSSPLTMEVKAFKMPKECIMVDQSAITTSKRLIVASTMDFLSDIREVFYKTRLARERGYTMGHFSFNVARKGGCERCHGLGEEEIEMHFLSDISITCDSCRGKRYRNEILEVYHNGKNIHEVLELTIAEAKEFFYSYTKIVRKLDRLIDVGLGYLKCGFATAKLSSGERQRLKIARELAFEAAESKLYILDEPTTGLHFKDIQTLIYALDALVKKGGTVIVVEHNVEFLRSVDYLIDLGPKGGNEGGYVVAEGTVAEVKKTKKGYTSKYL
ncbi:excinuclease ABC subunit A [Spirochaetota bacterium]|nr:excinuclease ABC subunit A [Spirochaetota bacterium]